MLIREAWENTLGEVAHSTIGEERESKRNNRSGERD